MSRWDMALMEEAHAEAQTALAVEMPDADLSVAETEDIAIGFEAGVWLGILGCITVLERHGIIRLPKDGESRE